MNKEANKILIANISLPTANKEVPWALPKGCRWFTMHMRDGTAFRVAVEANKANGSNDPYWTQKANTSWDEKNFKVDFRLGYPLFLACGTAGKMVEVVIGIYDPSLECSE